MTSDHQKKLSETMKNYWQSPAWRKKMLKKQRAVGLRAYPSKE